MSFLKFPFFLVGASAFFFLACVSNRHVSDKYNDLIGHQIRATSKRTTLVFLVDGLPVSTLREGLSSGQLSQMKKYFLGSREQFYLARTTFPSLTFSGVGSLLTEKSPDQNGLFGNRILQQGEHIDFESPQNLKKLNQMIQGENIFSRLRAKGLKTVSFDYGFNADADAHMEEYDSEVALAILEKNYARVDAKLMGSLRVLLERTTPKLWPDFIFVHLIGLDLLSHDQGAKSSAVKKYLEFLDLEFAGVFHFLQKVESAKEREIVALLTSDHGFDDEIAHTFNLERIIQKRAPKMEMLNEGRYLSLYFPAYWSQSKKSELLRDLVSHPLIDLVAHKDGNQIHVQSHSQTALIAYGPRFCQESTFSISVFPTENSFLKVAGTPFACPEQLNENLNRLFYPYFMSNLSYYFESPGHPDALVLAKPGVSFKRTGRGQHGGPTSQETFVPLLIHNGVLRNTQQIPPLWELLKFL